MVYDENQREQIRDWSYRFGLCRNRNWIVRTNMTRCNLWWKPNKTTMRPMVRVWCMPKMKLSCHDRSDRVRSMIKTRQDSDVTDHIGLVYSKIEIELSGLGMVCDENQTRQWLDRSYRCDLHWKWYWTIMIDWTECSLWQKLERTIAWPII